MLLISKCFVSVGSLYRYNSRGSDLILNDYADVDGQMSQIKRVRFSIIFHLVDRAVLSLCLKLMYMIVGVTKH